jgi:hypothetical protein
MYAASATCQLRDHSRQWRDRTVLAIRWLIITKVSVPRSISRQFGGGVQQRPLARPPR